MISRGTYRLKFTIHSCDFPSDLLIGFAHKNIPENIIPYNSGYFWGIQPLL